MQLEEALRLGYDMGESAAALIWRVRVRVCDHSGGHFIDAIKYAIYAFDDDARCLEFLRAIVSEFPARRTTVLGQWPHIVRSRSAAFFRDVQKFVRFDEFGEFRYSLQIALHGKTVQIEEKLAVCTSLVPDWPVATPQWHKPSHYTVNLLAKHHPIFPLISCANPDMLCRVARLMGVARLMSIT